MQFFIDALAPDAKASEGRERTLYLAPSWLVNRTDVQAVAIANRDARNHARETITTDEFRKWLPTVFSAFAGKVIGNKCEEAL